MGLRKPGCPRILAVDRRWEPEVMSAGAESYDVTLTTQKGNLAFDLDGTPGGEVLGALGDSHCDEEGR